MQIDLTEDETALVYAFALEYLAKTWADPERKRRAGEIARKILDAILESPARAR